MTLSSAFWLEASPRGRRWVCVWRSIYGEHGDERLLTFTGQPIIQSIYQSHIVYSGTLPNWGYVYRGASEVWATNKRILLILRQSLDKNRPIEYLGERPNVKPGV